MKWVRAPIICAVVLAGIVAIVAATMRTSRGDSRDGRAHITWLVPMQLDRPLVEQLAAEFGRENPDVALRLVFVPGAQYQTKLKTLIASGHAPDMFYCGDVWVAYLRPFLLDLTPLFARDAAEIDLDDIHPRVLDACKSRGQYLFIPRWFSVSLLYYNRKHFDDANEPYPTDQWTWDEYLASAKRLTRRSADGKTVEVWGSHILSGWWGEWLTLVRQAGGDLFDANVTRCTLDEPSARRGMQFYVDKVRKHGVSPAPGFGPDQGFASGKLAMELVGHTGNWTMYNQIPGLEWDIQLLPAGPTPRNRAEVALDAVGASKDTRHPEACWRFFKFMMSKRSIRAHVDAGYLSIRKSVASETHLKPGFLKNPRHAEVAYEALRIADNTPTSADFIEIALDVIQPEIDRALVDGRDVDESCRRAAQAANDFIATLGTERGASEQ